MSTRTLCFELGVEELPAGELKGMALSLESGMCKGINEAGLSFEHSKTFWTPRRLAVVISGLQEAGEATTSEVLGPPVAAATDNDGAWTPAAIGFAKKQGVAPDKLIAISTPKGERLGLQKALPGKLAADVVPTIIETAVGQIPVSKRMRWGRARHEFLRPVQWLMLLFGEEVLELSLFNLNSDRLTAGHRFHSQGTVSLERADDYESVLKAHHVIPSAAEREAIICSEVAALAEEGETAIIDDSLLEEVGGLVEFPVALRGSFDPDFLSVPREALISSMREHQKYFHLEKADGSLVPSFITVSNIVSSQPDTVIKGNERVIRPRLADAAFFFATDKQTSLSSKSERLTGVTFQGKLGSLADKQHRIKNIACAIAPALNADIDIVTRASGLIKCDLVSDMVLEFPELQGITGAHYAKHDGESELVASIIEEHYWPKYSGDTLPSTPEAMTVALADRIDTLMGIFGIGEIPSGSKDPFALRRASLAVIRMALDSARDMPIRTLLSAGSEQFDTDQIANETVENVTAYLLDRLPAHYEESGIGVDVLRAALETGSDTFGDIEDRLFALVDFMGSELAESLAAANKRVANILAKSDAELGSIDLSLLTENAEKRLVQALQSVSEDIVTACSTGRFASALEQLASLRDPIDDFFDQVMVNADDPALKRNRLTILKQLREQFLMVADLAVLAR